MAWLVCEFYCDDHFRSTNILIVIERQSIRCPFTGQENYTICVASWVMRWNLLLFVSNHRIILLYRYLTILTKLVALLSYILAILYLPLWTSVYIYRALHINKRDYHRYVIKAPFSTTFIHTLKCFSPFFLYANITKKCLTYPVGSKDISVFFVWRQFHFSDGNMSKGAVHHADIGIRRHVVSIDYDLKIKTHSFNDTE